MNTAPVDPEPSVPPVDSASPEDPLDQLTRVLRSQRAALVRSAMHEGLAAGEALECVQDALCTWLARRAREPLPQDALLAASLTTTVRNAARNRRRLHRLARPHAAIDAAHEPEGDAADAERLLSTAETALRLKTCVAELREVERAVITLRLLEERSGEDVAQALGLSRAHVDVLVHRAKLTLRICMRAPDCPRG